ncbi:hypothetical protein USDA257_c17530 [Sinorhizobium fredii USDA 257]|uniref:Uncharacterized protein n=1 Tax=Sinorhizobium fredii (strain USDA 257) TaxID=1185652 RepID=I3X385_SINF2|nr:hypothetical protein USDA257_c17530 [Sinorhizobium fredii USDA 257]
MLRDWSMFPYAVPETARRNGLRMQHPLGESAGFEQIAPGTNRALQTQFVRVGQLVKAFL